MRDLQQNLRAQTAHARELANSSGDGRKNARMGAEVKEDEQTESKLPELVTEMPANAPAVRAGISTLQARGRPEESRTRSTCGRQPICSIRAADKVSLKFSLVAKDQGEHTIVQHSLFTRIDITRIEFNALTGMSPESGRRVKNMPPGFQAFRSPTARQGCKHAQNALGPVYK